MKLPHDQDTPNELRRMHSCPPEPGFLALAANSADVKDTRNQALQNLFSMDSNPALWCPFTDIVELSQHLEQATNTKQASLTAQQ